MLRLFAYDVKCKARWLYDDDSWRSCAKALLTDGTVAMFYYRAMQFSRRWRLTPFEFLFNKLNTAFCNCIIGRGAEFGRGFVLIHATGVVINGRVMGGEHVYLEHQVTIGAERRTSPQLGNRVFVGAGAKILGEVVIGSDVRIGANAVVLNDLPRGATAVGIPAKVVRVREFSDDSESTLAESSPDHADRTPLPPPDVAATEP